MQCERMCYSSLGRFKFKSNKTDKLKEFHYPPFPQSTSTHMHVYLVEKKAGLAIAEMEMIKVSYF